MASWQNQINWEDMGLAELLAGGMGGGGAGAAGGLAGMFSQPQMGPQAPGGIAAQLGTGLRPPGIPTPQDFSELTYKQLPSEAKQNALRMGLAEGLSMYRPQANDSPWGIIANLATGVLKGRQAGLSDYVQEAKDAEDRRRREALDQMAIARQQSLIDAARANVSLSEAKARTEKEAGERRFQSALSSGLPEEMAEQARHSATFYEKNVLGPQMDARQRIERAKEIAQLQVDYPNLADNPRWKMALKTYEVTGKMDELNEVLEDAMKPAETSDKDTYTYEEAKPYVDSRATVLIEEEGYAPGQAYSVANNEVRRAYDTGGWDVVKEVFKGDKKTAARVATGKPPRPELETPNIAELASEEQQMVMKELGELEGLVADPGAMQAVDILRQQAGDLRSYAPTLRSMQEVLRDQYNITEEVMSEGDEAVIRALVAKDPKDPYDPTAQMPLEEKIAILSLTVPKAPGLMSERQEWLQRRSSRTPNPSLASNLPVDKETQSPETTDPQVLVSQATRTLEKMDIPSAYRETIQQQMMADPREFNRVLQSRFNGNLKKMIEQTILQLQAQR